MKISAERGMKMVELDTGISKRQRLKQVGVVDLEPGSRSTCGISSPYLRQEDRTGFPHRREFPRPLSSGDATQLEQVPSSTLCINAHDAMTVMRTPEEERRGTLSVLIDRVPVDGDFLARYADASEIDYIRIRVVEDGGVGMDSFVLAHVFDPFFHHEGNLRGTGPGASPWSTTSSSSTTALSTWRAVSESVPYRPSLSLRLNSRKAPWRGPGDGSHDGEGADTVDQDDTAHPENMRKDPGDTGYDVIVAENGQRGIDIYRERHGEIDADPRHGDAETIGEGDLRRAESDRTVGAGSRILVFRNDSRIGRRPGLGARAFLQKPYTMEQLSKVLAEILGSTDG